VFFFGGGGVEAGGVYGSTVMNVGTTECFIIVIVWPGDQLHLLGILLLWEGFCLCGRL
jgi:hypothetical protein